MGQPVVHFEIHGQDQERLAGFYSEIFGWHVNADNPHSYGMVDTHAGGRGIAGGMTTSDMAPRVLIYVEVEDPQATLDAVGAAGGKVVMPVTEIPGAVTMAIFTDPEGNTIGLVKAQQHT